jgi:hypothetical protein
MINLGDLVQDKISGFKGVVLAKMEALYEATQYRVHPQTLDANGRIRPNCWLEGDRLEVIEQFAVVGFKEIAGTDADPAKDEKVNPFE